METNRLKQFCVIVETGNLRKASEILGISHSGLSKSMRALSDEVGYELFQPSGRGIVVSDQGRRLYEKAPAFLSELAALVGRSEQKKFLRIGSFEVFTSYFMGILIKDYIQDVEVEVHELVPGKLEEALILNRIDLGITYEPLPRPGIDYVKVKTLTMGTFVRKRAFEGLAQEKMPYVCPVLPFEGAPSGVRGRDGWPDERFHRNIRFRVDLMNTGIELVKQGLCAIFIPRFVAELHNQSAPSEFQLEERELPKGFGSVKRNVYIVKRESTPEDQTIRKVASALRDIKT